jgi:hypothetical protein
MFEHAEMTIESKVRIEPSRGYRVYPAGAGIVPYIPGSGFMLFTTSSAIFHWPLIRCQCCR